MNSWFLREPSTSEPLRCNGRGGSAPTLPVCVTVGPHLPHAVGVALAAQYRKDPVAVIAWFGDGATSKGDFHESFNMAGVFRLPLVFVCQNNQWAISVPRSSQTASATLAQKAITRVGDYWYATIDSSSAGRINVDTLRQRQIRKIEK